MLDVRERARVYFSSSVTDPWRWTEQSKVLVWSDGTTIAFREEVVEILNQTAMNGLPPFSAVVVLLAACRGKFPSAEAVSFSHSPRGLRAKQQIPLPFPELIAPLHLLHELPAELKNCARAKSVLIDSVFDNLRISRIQPGREIVTALRHLTEYDDLNSGAPREATLANTCRLLYAGLRNFSADALALRLKTGLDIAPQAADIALKPAERARQLLAQLQNDAEQQGLAKVARDIMAALYLPRSLSELDELALGGVSDISNRGSLDRLLPSELAHDDVTLAARIALNEALYFRREPPSNHPPAQFAVLIDIGLRQWGLPRIFAASVALACIAKEEHCSTATIWRARRNGIEECDLLTRKGLIDHLSALDSYAHPGTALKRFFTQFETQPDVEAILITHRDCLLDPEFQRYLSQVMWPTFYIAAVDRDGTFTLSLHPHWQKQLCAAKISLDSLFSSGSEAMAQPSAALRDKKYNPDLPLIFSVDPFPFGLPIVGRVDTAIRMPSGGGVAVMNDRRVLRWLKPGEGAVTIFEKLPPGKTVWLGTSDYGKRVHVVRFQANRTKALLCSRSLSIDEPVEHEFVLSKAPQRVFAENGFLFLWSADLITVIDLQSGVVVATTSAPACTGSHNNFFADEAGKWKSVCYDGTGICFHPVPLQFKVAGDTKIHALFNRQDGSESLPWALTSRGEVFSGDGTRVINLGRYVARCQVSADGHRILVPGVGDRDFQLIDLQRNVCPAVVAKKAQLALEPQPILPTRSLRVKLSSICISESGDLFIKPAHTHWLKICAVDSRIQLVPQPNEAFGNNRVQDFGPATSSSDVNCVLKLASWEDGTRAWLDSRGLLHLKSADRSRPEVSIVLADGPMAVWASDGKICGPTFFIGNQQPDEPGTLMKRIEMCAPLG